MALPKYMYRDPCDVLESKQEHELRKSCAGCVHTFKIEIAGGVEQGCRKGKKHGKRCNLYRLGGVMFSSADQALRWAARVHYSEIIDGPSIYGMHGSRPSTRNALLIGLDPKDAHMQAEKILGYARDLHDKAESQYILAKYIGQEDLDALMARVFAGLLYSGGGVYQRGIRKLVLEYMGVKVTHDELRNALNCGSNRVKDFRDQVYNVMGKIHYRAMDNLENKMSESGLISFHGERYVAG